jgi:glucose-6-phosphate 1-dehydrogenase
MSNNCGENDCSLKSDQPVDPFTIVIFGASGDLTKRKLMPSIFNLFQMGLFPKNFAIVGMSTSLDTEKFRHEMIESVTSAIGSETLDHELVDKFSKHLYYVKGSIEEEKSFFNLKRDLENIESEWKLSGKRIYYLAVAPHFFCPIVIQLGKTGMAEETNGQWKRVIIEKPQGHDLDSSRDLAKNINQSFKENQIYRIDHYLGKETVQNIMILRFANGIFEPTWNRRYIDSVQITVSEELGVERRGKYYDDIGALRDMIPSHLFQLLSLIAMEPPASFETEAVRDEYKKVLNSIVPFKPEDILNQTVRGQYSEGKMGDKSVPAYRDELNVKRDSTTETFVAMRLMIDNWRWSGVPFYLRTGKRLKKRGTEVVIQFKAAPVKLFCQTPMIGLARNQLVLHIQPEEGISLQFGAKIPGLSMQVKNVNMDFKYQDYFGKQSSTGYETLLYDCMKGEAALFRREDQVDLAWQIMAPILEVWKSTPPKDFPNYEAGTWGPKAAEELLARDDRQWKEIT